MSTDHDSSAVRVRVWGARGSIPSPGDSTVAFGGNTPCVEVQTPASRIILDAGTGLRRLGRHLAGTHEPVDAALVLTHYHWDHIQGFPFFAPLYTPGTRLRVRGPGRSGDEVEGLLSDLMDPVHFPVPLRTLAAGTSFEALGPGPWTHGDATLETLRVRHPSPTVGVRIQVDGVRICYLPDNELVGGDYGVGEGWRERLVDFVAGADLLLHDGMYTEEEMRDRRGWGHSTPGQAVELAAEAGVAALHLFHHAPWRADEELERLLARTRAEAGAVGFVGRVEGAREGSETVLGPGT